jgi:branched-chain amino acid transport system substrate-binding protein
MNVNQKRAAYMAIGILLVVSAAASWFIAIATIKSAVVAAFFTSLFALLAILTQIPHIQNIINKDLIALQDSVERLLDMLRPLILQIGLRTIVSIILIIALVGTGTLIYPTFMTSLFPPLINFYPHSTVIKIATDFPTSGDEREDGLSLQDGVDMAIKQANNDKVIPDYTLEPVYNDDTGDNNIHDPRIGAQNVEKVAQEGLVAGMIGPLNSNVAMNEIPLASQYSLPLISPGNTYPCLTKSDTASGCSGAQNIIAQLYPDGQNKSTYFRLSTTDDILGKRLADYLFYQQGYRTFSLIEDPNDPYSYALAQAFHQEWELIGGQERGFPLNVPLGQTNVNQYMAYLQEIAPQPPNFIFFSGVLPDAIYVKKAMMEIPNLQHTPFVGGSGIVTPGFATNIDPGGGPVFAAMPLADSDMVPSGEGFKQQFSLIYPNDKFRAYTAGAFDATNILIQAIKQALKNTQTPHGDWDMKGAIVFRQNIVNALRNIPYNGGVTGNYTFNQLGDNGNDTVTIYQLNQSNWQILPCNASGDCFNVKHA